MASPINNISLPSVDSTTPIQASTKLVAEKIPISSSPLCPTSQSVPTFKELWFDNPIEGQNAQKIALELQYRIELKAFPIRLYLERFVVPILLQGMQHLVLERPNNPIEYLAAFLLKNNPQKVERPEQKNIETTIDPTRQENLTKASNTIQTLPTLGNVPIALNKLSTPFTDKIEI